MSINTKAQNDKENILEDKGYASVKDWMESEWNGFDINNQQDFPTHWCDRSGSTSEDKLNEYQPYYAGDLTQK